MRLRLFGSSGIRGIANEDITTKLVQKVGQALANKCMEGVLVVGRDTRYTGKMFEAAMSGGIVSTGVNLYKVGIVPTPITAWMIGKSKADGGVQISASHNPAQYNGLKIFNSKGMSFNQNEQEFLEKSIEASSFALASWDKVGKMDDIDAISPYANTLPSLVEIRKKWKISLDLFNGAACTAVPKVFKQFPFETSSINAVPDGKFPAGIPEPSKTSMNRLGNFIKEVGSEIGFGFDGDADRMMTVDSRGVMINPDRILAAYSGYIIEKNRGGIVITHIGTSMNIDEMVTSAGGKVVRTPVGDTFISEAIAAQDAIFGGEPVGAWIHPEVHMCPDGILSALKLIEALEEKEMKLIEFSNQAPNYPIEREKIRCANDKKTKVMSVLTDNYQDSFKKIEKIITLDGVRIELEQGWVLIRPSGTEPIIRITAEAKTKKDVKKLMEKGKSLVKRILVKIK
jgi:phosphoglucosamine mutase